MVDIDFDMSRSSTLKIRFDSQPCPDLNDVRVDRNKSKVEVRNLTDWGILGNIVACNVSFANYDIYRSYMEFFKGNATMSMLQYSSN